MSSVQDCLFEVRINRKPFTNTLRPGGSLIKIIGSVGEGTGKRLFRPLGRIPDRHRLYWNT